MRRLGLQVLTILLVAGCCLLAVPRDRRANAAQVLYAIGTAVDAYSTDGNYVRHLPLPTIQANRASLAPDGNLFVSDGVIRRINSSTGANMGTFIAPGTGGLTSPTALALGPDNDLYVGMSSAILQFDGTTGAFISSFTSANIINPMRLSFGHDGLLYVADSGSNKILRFASLAAGTVPDTLASVPNPTGLALAPNGSLYVALANASIIDLTPGTPSWTIQPFASGTSIGLTTPNSVFVDDLGNVFVGNSGQFGPNVFEYNSSGQLLREFGTGYGVQDIVWPVPEPASVGLLGVAMGVLLRRRR